MQCFGTAILCRMMDDYKIWFSQIEIYGSNPTGILIAKIIGGFLTDRIGQILCFFSVNLVRCLVCIVVATNLYEQYKYKYHLLHMTKISLMCKRRRRRRLKAKALTHTINRQPSTVNQTAGTCFKCILSINICLKVLRF